MVSVPYRPPTRSGGNCGGWHASYWNAVLFKIEQRNKPDQIYEGHRNILQFYDWPRPFRCGHP